MADMKKISGLTWAALALVFVGALNWGLVGLFNYNLVEALFGHMTAITRVLYVIVGLAGIYLAADSVRLREERRGPTLREAHRPIV